MWWEGQCACSGMAGKRGNYITKIVSKQHDPLSLNQRYFRLSRLFRYRGASAIAAFGVQRDGAYSGARKELHHEISVHTARSVFTQSPLFPFIRFIPLFWLEPRHLTAESSWQMAPTDAARKENAFNAELSHFANVDDEAAGEALEVFGFTNGRRSSRAAVRGARGGRRLRTLVWPDGKHVRSIAFYDPFVR
jgi:hypothetical protein